MYSAKAYSAASEKSPLASTTIARRDVCELHISSRTLQRRLQDAGYSFQQVLEEARHQLASHYLNGSQLELSETAYLLGYEDSNSFVRAFRAWSLLPSGAEACALKPRSRHRKITVF